MIMISFFERFSEMVKDGDTKNSTFNVDSFVSKIDGLTVIQSLLVNFSYPPTYEYVIRETGETFSSCESNKRLAYMEWKNKKEGKR